MKILPHRIPSPPPDDDPVGDAVEAVIAERFGADGTPELPPDAPVYDLYLRVSSPGQDQEKDEYGRVIRTDGARPSHVSAAERKKRVKKSLATQEILLRMEARSRGIRVGQVHRDTHTATELFERPAFQALQRRVASGAIRGILIVKVERFSRRLGFLNTMQHLCTQHEVDLVFVQNPAVDSSPVGRFLGSALEFAAEMALESMKEQFARHKRARLEAGQPLHGPKPPFGCRWEDEARKRYVWVEEEVAVLRILFGAFLDGRSIRGVAADLTKDGVPTPKGGKTWHTRTIRMFLQNPLYAGLPAGNRWRVDWRRAPGGATEAGGVFGPGPKKRRRQTYRDPAEQLPLDPPVWPDGRTEPPVSPEDFARVQELLGGARARHRGGRPVPEEEGWLLRGGFARCESCEGPLYVSRRRRTRSSVPDPVAVQLLYVCGANNDGPGKCTQPVTISKERLENTVWLRLLGVLSNPEALTEAVRRYREGRALTPEGKVLAQAEQAAARGAIAEAERAIANLTEQLAHPKYPEVVGPLQAKLAGEVRALAAAKELQGRAEARLARAAAVERELLAFEPLARRLCARLARPTPALCRTVVEILRPDVVVPPSPPGGKGREDTIRVAVLDEIVTQTAALERVLAGFGDPGERGGDREGDAPQKPGSTRSGSPRFLSPTPPRDEATPSEALRIVLAPDGSLRVA